MTTADHPGLRIRAMCKDVALDVDLSSVGESRSAKHEIISARPILKRWYNNRVIDQNIQQCCICLMKNYVSG